MFKHILLSYNQKCFAPMLEAWQEKIFFHYARDFDMLRLNCTSPNLASLSPPKSTDEYLIPLMKVDEKLLENIREDVVCGPSIVFGRRAVVGAYFL